MVLFPCKTLRIRVTSEFSSALLRAWRACAHTSILFLSSSERSFTRKCDTISEATAMTTATSTNTILTCRILSVHCMKISFGYHSKRHCNVFIAFPPLRYYLVPKRSPTLDMSYLYFLPMSSWIYPLKYITIISLLVFENENPWYCRSLISVFISKKIMQWAGYNGVHKAYHHETVRHKIKRIPIWLPFHYRKGT